jgi:hypothetical protein
MKVRFPLCTPSKRHLIKWIWYSFTCGHPFRFGWL